MSDHATGTAQRRGRAAKGFGIRVHRRGIEWLISPTLVVWVVVMTVGMLCLDGMVDLVRRVTPSTPQAWTAAGITAAAVLVGTIVHEAGHAYAGTQLGFPPIGVRLSMAPAVSFEYLDPITHAKVAAAGPAAGFLAGVVIVVASWSITGVQPSPVANGGAFYAAWSLLYVFTPWGDGATIHRGIGNALDRRRTASR